MHETVNAVYLSDPRRVLATRIDREEHDMPKITPFLWFDGNVEEAMSFYLSIFKNKTQMPGRPRVSCR